MKKNSLHLLKDSEDINQLSGKKQEQIELKLANQEVNKK
jgi:hypothetical protein